MYSWVSVRLFGASYLLFLFFFSLFLSLAHLILFRLVVIFYFFPCSIRVFRRVFAEEKKDCKKSQREFCTIFSTKYKKKEFSYCAWSYRALLFVIFSKSCDIITQMASCNISYLLKLHLRIWSSHKQFSIWARTGVHISSIHTLPLTHPHAHTNSDCYNSIQWCSTSEITIINLQAIIHYHELKVYIEGIKTKNGVACAVRLLY